MRDMCGGRRVERTDFLCFFDFLCLLFFSFLCLLFFSFFSFCSGRTTA